MNITKLSNVIGSIGSIVNDAKNIFGPAAGRWQASLVKASFGGVPFGVNAARTHAGRRLAIHTYPYRDEVWVEDQGKLPRQFHIQGFLVEESLVYGGGGVVAQREALLAACEAGVTKTLVHPTFGTIKNVKCLELEIEERKDLGRVFEFTLQLIITGERKYPSTKLSTQDTVKAAAQKTRLQALKDFVQKTAHTVQEKKAVISKTVSAVRQYYRTVVALISHIKRVFNAVSSLAGNFGRLFGGGNVGYAASNQRTSAMVSTDQLLAANVAAMGAVVAAGQRLQLAATNIADANAYGAAATAFLDSVAATAADPADSIAMLKALASYSIPNNTIHSPMGQAIAAVNNANAAYLRRLAIARMAEVVTTYQPASQNDAFALQTTVTSVIDAEILTAADTGDAASYEALCMLRVAMVADLQARGASLAKITTFAFGASQPALALSHRLYRDASRVEELVRQVNPIHPAFMPTTFEALAR